MHSVPLHVVAGTLAGVSVPILVAMAAKRYGFTWLFTLRERPPARPVAAVPAVGVSPGGVAVLPAGGVGGEKRFP